MHQFEAKQAAVKEEEEPSRQEAKVKMVEDN
jgi:hypothetical protein